MMPEKNLKSAINRRLSGVKAGESHQRQVLLRIQGEKKVKKKTSLALVITFAVIAVVGIALAATLPITLEWINNTSGRSLLPQALTGTVMPLSQKRTLGDVVYEWTENVHVGENEAADSGDSNFLSGAVRITHVDGSRLTLIPVSYTMTDFEGRVTLHDGEAPPELADELVKILEGGGRVLLADAVPQGLVQDGRLRDNSQVSFAFDRSNDGSLTYYYEISDVQSAAEYTVKMEISNCELTVKDGQLFRQPDKEMVDENWVVTSTAPAEKTKE